MSPVGQDHLCATHLRRRSVCGSSLIAWSVSVREVGVAGESSLRRGRRAPAGETSLRVCAIHGNDASIVAGVSRTPGRISRANARVGGNDGVERGERAVGVLRASAPAGGSSAAGCRASRGERRHRRVEVGDQVLERVLVADQRAGGLARCRAIRRGEVAVGLGAEQRLEDLRGRLLGGRDVVVGVVERLRRRSCPRATGRRRASCAAVGLELSAVAEAVEQVLEVLARVALQRRSAPRRAAPASRSG